MARHVIILVLLLLVKELNNVFCNDASENLPYPTMDKDKCHEYLAEKFQEIQSMVDLMQSNVLEAMEKRFKSLDEKLQEIIQREEKIASEVNEIKGYREQQTQLLKSKMDQELALEDSLSKDLFADKFESGNEKSVEKNISVSDDLGKVSGRGVFGVRLNSFANDLGKDVEGHCCSGFLVSNGKCSGECRTKFRVCLKHYQPIIDPNTPCTFGEVVSPVLGNNSVRFDDVDHEGFENPIAFVFDFEWPGVFLLVVEAWHATTGGEDTLISRFAIQRWLDVSENWSQEEHKDSDFIMRYEYRFRCNPHYYGDSCQNLCLPRDDNFGHYICSETGQRICLAGWTGEYCINSMCPEGCHEQHGSCTRLNECKCQLGWKGPFCDQCVTYPGCIHGSCQFPWECNCHEGWEGLFCNQAIIP